MHKLLIHLVFPAGSPLSKMGVFFFPKAVPTKRAAVSNPRYFFLFPPHYFLFYTHARLKLLVQYVGRSTSQGYAVYRLGRYCYYPGLFSSFGYFARLFCWVWDVKQGAYCTFTGAIVAVVYAITIETLLVGNCRICMIFTARVYFVIDFCFCCCCI